MGPDPMLMGGPPIKGVSGGFYSQLHAPVREGSYIYGDPVTLFDADSVPYETLRGGKNPIFS
jgi:hypothetical protein